MNAPATVKMHVQCFFSGVPFVWPVRSPGVASKDMTSTVLSTVSVSGQRYGWDHVVRFIVLFAVRAVCSSDAKFLSPMSKQPTLLRVADAVKFGVVGPFFLYYN